MTAQKHHDGGDCNTTILNRQADPPVRNSLFVSILLGITSVLIISFATVVYSQMKDTASLVKEQQLKNDAQEVRIVQLETAFFYIKKSLENIESNTKITADKVDGLERRMKK